MPHRTAERPSAIDPRVRRYATRVTLVIIVACNIILLVGLRVSGVDVNDLIRTPDVYDLQRDVCVRSGWHRVSGVDKPVRLCAEWINLSDRSGKTHLFQRDTLVVQGGDGKLYLDHGPRVDYRLLLLVVFVLVLIVAGIMAQRYLIARHRVRVEATEAQDPSGIH